MSRVYFFVILLLASYAAGAAEKVKYGKVSKSEISLNQCAFDPAAEAVYLRYVGSIVVHHANVHIKRHVRIKILHPNALGEANIKLPYYSSDNYERISSIKAHTINIDENGKAHYFPVDKSQFFTVDLSEDWKEMRFTFPNVKQGSILEYEYTLISANHLYLENWEFQHHLPTLYSSLSVQTPKSLDYQFMMQGSRLYRKYRDKPSNHWELEDLPALKEEPFLYNQGDFVEKVRFQLSGYYAQDQMKNVEYKSLRRSWESLADEVLNSNEYRSYLNRSGFAKNTVAELELEGKSPEEKIREIYKYVTDNYRWNGLYRRFTYNKLAAISKNTEANSAEINLLLVLLLNTAGIEAHPMLVSTRSHGLYFKNYPLLSQFNHLMVYAKIDDRDFFLDATDPLLPYDVLPVQVHIAEGFVLDKREPHWQEISIEKKARERYTASIRLHAGQVVDVSMGFEAMGHFAANARRQLISKGTTKWLEDQVSPVINASSDSLSIQNLEEVEEFLKAQAHFQYKLTTHEGQQTFYLNPFLLDKWLENPFKTDTRQYPVQFPFLSTTIYTCEIVIPEGMQVVELPKTEKIKMPNDYGDFTYRVVSNGGKITVQIIFNINKLEAPSNQYQNFREFYGMVASRLNQHIVLKSIR